MYNRENILKPYKHNCLAIVNPKLTKEWFFDKNNGLKPEDVTIGSNKKVWWICDKGHEWEAQIVDRAKNNYGCPYCSGQRVCDDNCLEMLRPDLAKQWHPTKNNGLTPNDVTLFSHKKVWWICDKGHEWEAVVSSRSGGCGCPYCTGKKACYDNCLETLKPELSKQWHPTKNNDLTPKDVTISSGKKVWWVCDKEHEWEAIISSRVSGRGCPYCGGKKVCVDNSLETLKPELAKQWHPTKNNNLTPKDVTLFSHKKVWWICDKEHEWEANVSDRTRGRGCPYCGGKKACDDNCLETLNPELAKQWHPTKNNNLTPRDVTQGSNKRAWWFCDKGHEWEAVISSRTAGVDCPYCTGQKVCDDNCLETLKPDIAKQWHPTKNKDLTTKDVTIGSGRKFWWVCDKGHEWKAIVSSRADGSGCPYCIGQKVCDDNCLETLRPDLAKQWHPTKNNNLTPKDVTQGSNKKVWWICSKGHEWEAAINPRTSCNKTGCPYCSNSTSYPDKYIYYIMCEVFGVENVFLRHIFKYNNRNIEVDCFISSIDTAIEYDGRWYHNDLSKDIEKSKKILNMCNELIRVREYPLVNIYLSNVKCFFVDKGQYDKTLKAMIIELLSYLYSKYEDNVFKKSYNDVLVILEDDDLQIKIESFYSIDSEAKSLASSLIAKEWHPTKNGVLTPKDVTIGSRQKVWWLCDKGHEWKTAICNRTSHGKTSCPYCKGKLACEDNCLESLNSDLAKQWHPTKNGSLTPKDVTASSGKKVWWICDKGHEWKTGINNRARGTGCPYCSGNKVCIDNCLEVLRPELASEWHLTKNGSLTPRDVTIGTHKKIWWKCEKGHEWQAAVFSRSKGRSCPFCKGVKVCTDNCLATLKPELAKEWHPTKNNGLTSNDVTVGSGKKVWWKCEKGHEWKATIANRSKGVGCPQCYNLSRSKKASI